MISERYGTERHLPGSLKLQAYDLRVGRIRLSEKGSKGNDD